MAAKKRKAAPAVPAPAERVGAVLARLEAMATKRDRDNLARFGIDAPKAFGVSMANLKVLAKELGPDHALAADLWSTGWHEARMLACLVDEPARVTPAQMDRWQRDFDNWAICDTACFVLFDRTPHAFAKVKAWRGARGEQQKRAAFALLASLALHGGASEGELLRGLDFIRDAAGDERNFVKKGVNWALRAIGGRSAKLHAAALALAKELAASQTPGARWIGKDALRDLLRPLIAKRLASRKRKGA